MKKAIILDFYSRPQTVFQIEELTQLFPEINPRNLRRSLHYFAKAGKIKNLRRGLYAKNTYEALELANKIYTPSYISFETVLFKEEVIFQYYETIFVASYLSRDIIVDGHKISYRQIGKPALSNKSGIEERNGYFVASKERAFLDAVFLYKDYYFDNLSGLNWNEVFELAPIYASVALDKRIKQYYKHYQEEYGTQQRLT